MNTYETSTTVKDHGQVRLDGVPFAPGTEVEITVMEAIEVRRRFQISYWDAAIIAAAKRMDCTSVYSEDLNLGQYYDGVTVVNPFAGVIP